MGTLGQKCFTSGVHFSGMFSVPGEKRCQPKDSRASKGRRGERRGEGRGGGGEGRGGEGAIKKGKQYRVMVQNSSHDGLLCRLLGAKMFLAAVVLVPTKSIKAFNRQSTKMLSKYNFYTV